MKYEVSFIRDACNVDTGDVVDSYWSVIVEAESEEEAEKIAMKQEGVSEDAMDVFVSEIEPATGRYK